MSDPVTPSTPTPPTASGSSLPATPTAKLSALDDPTKKYTLIFLVSVGTTLLLTGSSGGRLLKRAKATTPPTPTAAPSPSAPLAARPPPPPPAGPSAPAPISPNLPPSYFSPQPPQSFPSPKPQHLLKTFRLSPSSPSTLRPTSAGAPSDYFLPNATLLAHSNEFAEELDRADRLHKDGPEQPDAPDDGFNPAVFAAKAFAIATALTVSAFAAGIGGLMYYLGAEDLESLSLALSHSLPPILASHRPALPAWALPASPPPDSPLPAGTNLHPSNPAPTELAGPDSDADSQEGISYWTEVKQTLDREAEERVARRKAEWERRFRVAQAGKEGEGRVV